MVHDTKLLSRFGALSWRSETPVGTAVALQVRSGNVGEPDETWSSWSAPQTDASAARAESPPGRFVQYRVKMSTRDPARTPELLSVALFAAIGQPSPRDRQARGPRCERRRRRHPADPADCPVGRDRPQRRRAELHRLASQGGLAKLDQLDGAADHREELHVGHDGVSIRVLPDQARCRRPPLEQPRGGP